jgi:hypothetical protein
VVGGLSFLAAPEKVLQRIERIIPTLALIGLALVGGLENL